MENDNKFKILQWEIQNQVVGLTNKNPIQVKDNIMNNLYNQFNLTYPFNYSNFKLHIRNINVSVEHSIREKYNGERNYGKR